MENNRHAYLIMAHNQFDILKYLLKALDDPRNDIYVHLDKKVRNFDFEEYGSLLKYSNLYYTKKRLDVAWGGDTQIKCELLLLKAAHLKQYSYYHLLSGVDYPIKSQDYIHEFFKKNAGKNFIDYESDDVSLKFAKDRIEYRHYLQNLIGRSKGKKREFLERVEFKLLRIQYLLGFSRLKDNKLILKKGASWFSITDEMVKEVLKNEKIIKKYFFRGLCADEMFIMTIAYNSPLKDTLVCDTLRYIVWNGGKHPKLLGSEDLNDIKQSKALWARKFSYPDSLELINDINQFIERRINILLG